MRDYDYLSELMELNQAEQNQGKAHEEIEAILAQDPELLTVFLEILRSSRSKLPGSQSTNLRLVDEESTFDLWDNYNRNLITGGEFLSAMGKKAKGQLSKIGRFFSGNKKPSEEYTEVSAFKLTVLPRHREDKPYLEDFSYPSQEPNKQISQNYSETSCTLKDKILILRGAKVSKWTKR
ncbi:MAG: hypothetical protein LBE38_06935 [Deltaproteobacteria bacterium]|jgi:hypothetical protein|nr:hypothetical protein [Deltaproteobacteria bacterium]